MTALPGRSRAGRLSFPETMSFPEISVQSMTIFPKKSFGQHWLKSKPLVEKIVDAAELTGRDHVLEIGPGTGLLTEALVDKTNNLVAVEADRDLIHVLRKKFGPDLNLIKGDILKIPNNEFFSNPKIKYKIVANLPYNIASAVIIKFLVEEPRPSRMVVMVQKEVADRITAKPPDMGVLSVVCQLYADVKQVCKVKPGSFSPPPKVDSAVVRFDLVSLSRKKIKPIEAEAIIKLAKAGFASRRKQLQKNLAAAKIVSAERTRLILKKMKLPETARAEELSVKDWITFFRLISKVK